MSTPSISPIPSERILTQPSTASVNVFVRFRPVIEGEIPSTTKYTIGEDNKTLRISHVSERISSHTSIADNTDFKFHRVFSPKSKNAEVFTALAPSVINAITANLNASLVMYGQTGGGKTHTMIGAPPEVGIAHRMVDEIFEYLSCSALRGVVVKVSAIQIYLSQVHDLLLSSSRDPRGKKLDARIGGTRLRSERPVTTADEVHALINHAARLRETGSHLMNKTSSRSHCIIYLTVTHDRGKSRIIFVDLAGSERLHKTQATGDAFEEGRAVNASLLALGGCLEALAARRPHIPFRDNILTWYLQDCFVNGFTGLLCCCSTAKISDDETRCTINYGDIAKRVQISRTPVAAERIPRISEQDVSDAVAAVEEKYKADLSELQKENDRLFDDYQKLHKKYTEESAMWNHDLKYLQSQIDAAMLREEQQRVLREGLEGKLEEISADEETKQYIRQLIEENSRLRASLVTSQHEVETYIAERKELHRHIAILIDQLNSVSSRANDDVADAFHALYGIETPKPRIPPWVQSASFKSFPSISDMSDSMEPTGPPEPNVDEKSVQTVLARCTIDTMRIRQELNDTKDQLEAMRNEAAKVGRPSISVAYAQTDADAKQNRSVQVTGDLPTTSEAAELQRQILSLTSEVERLCHTNAVGDASFDHFTTALKKINDLRSENIELKNVISQVHSEMLDLKRSIARSSVFHQEAVVQSSIDHLAGALTEGGTSLPSLEAAHERGCIDIANDEKFARSQLHISLLIDMLDAKNKEITSLTFDLQSNSEMSKYQIERLLAIVEHRKASDDLARSERRDALDDGGEAPSKVAQLERIIEYLRNENAQYYQLLQARGTDLGALSEEPSPSPEPNRLTRASRRLSYSSFSRNIVDESQLTYTSLLCEQQEARAMILSEMLYEETMLQRAEFAAKTQELADLQQLASYRAMRLAKMGPRPTPSTEAQVIVPTENGLPALMNAESMSRQLAECEEECNRFELARDHYFALALILLVEREQQHRELFEQHQIVEYQTHRLCVFRDLQREDELLEKLRDAEATINALRLGDDIPEWQGENVPDAIEDVGETIAQLRAENEQLSAMEEEHARLIPLLTQQRDEARAQLPLPTQIIEQAEDLNRSQNELRSLEGYVAIYREMFAEVAWMHCQSADQGAVFNSLIHQLEDTREENIRLESELRDLQDEVDALNNRQHVSVVESHERNVHAEPKGEPTSQEGPTALQMEEAPSGIPPEALAALRAIEDTEELTRGQHETHFFEGYITLLCECRNEACTMAQELHEELGAAYNRPHVAVVAAHERDVHAAPPGEAEAPPSAVPIALELEESPGTQDFPATTHAVQRTEELRREKIELLYLEDLVELLDFWCRRMLRSLQGESQLAEELDLERAENATLAFDLEVARRKVEEARDAAEKLEPLGLRAEQAEKDVEELREDNNQLRQLAIYQALEIMQTQLHAVEHTEELVRWEAEAGYFRAAGLLVADSRRNALASMQQVQIDEAAKFHAMMIQLQEERTQTLEAAAQVEEERAKNARMGADIESLIAQEHAHSILQTAELTESGERAELESEYHAIYAELIHNCHDEACSIAERIRADEAAKFGAVMLKLQQERNHGVALSQDLQEARAQNASLLEEAAAEAEAHRFSAAVQAIERTQELARELIEVSFLQGALSISCASAADLRDKHARLGDRAMELEGAVASLRSRAAQAELKLKDALSTIDALSSKALIASIEHSEELVRGHIESQSDSNTVSMWCKHAIELGEELDKNYWRCEELEGEVDKLQKEIRKMRLESATVIRVLQNGKHEAERRAEEAEAELDAVRGSEAFNVLEETEGVNRFLIEASFYSGYAELAMDQHTKATAIAIQLRADEAAKFNAMMIQLQEERTQTLEATAQVEEERAKNARMAADIEALIAQEHARSILQTAELTESGERAELESEYHAVCAELIHNCHEKACVIAIEAELEAESFWALSNERSRSLQEVTDASDQLQFLGVLRAIEHTEELTREQHETHFFEGYITLLCECRNEACTMAQELHEELGAAYNRPHVAVVAAHERDVHAAPPGEAKGRAPPSAIAMEEAPTALHMEEASSGAPPEALATLRAVEHTEELTRGQIESLWQIRCIDLLREWHSDAIFVLALMDWTYEARGVKVSYLQDELRSQRRSGRLSGGFAPAVDAAGFHELVGKLQQTAERLHEHTEALREQSTARLSVSASRLSVSPDRRDTTESLGSCLEAHDERIERQGIELAYYEGALPLAHGCFIAALEVSAAVAANARRADVLAAELEEEREKNSQLSNSSQVEAQYLRNELRHAKDDAQKNAAEAKQLSSELQEAREEIEMLVNREPVQFAPVVAREREVHSAAPPPAAAQPPTAIAMEEPPATAAPEAHSETQLQAVQHSEELKRGAIESSFLRGCVSLLNALHSEACEIALQGLDVIWQLEDERTENARLSSQLEDARQWMEALNDRGHFSSSGEHTVPLHGNGEPEDTDSDALRHTEELIRGKMESEYFRATSMLLHEWHNEAVAHVREVDGDELLKFNALIRQMQSVRQENVLLEEEREKLKRALFQSQVENSNLVGDIGRLHDELELAYAAHDGRPPEARSLDPDRHAELEELSRDFFAKEESLRVVTEALCAAQRENLALEQFVGKMSLRLEEFAAFQLVDRQRLLEEFCFQEQQNQTANEDTLVSLRDSLKLMRSDTEERTKREARETALLRELDVTKTREATTAAELTEVRNENAQLRVELSMAREKGLEADRSQIVIGQMKRHIEMLSEREGSVQQSSRGASMEKTDEAADFETAENISEMKATISQLSFVRSALLSQKTALEHQLQDMRTENDRLREELKQAQTGSSGTKEVKPEDPETKQEIAQLRAELEEASSRHAEEIRKLREELKQAESANSGASSKEVKPEDPETKQEIAQLQEELEEASSRHAEEIRKLREELNQSNNAREKSAMSAKGVEIELQAQYNRRAALERECNALRVHLDDMQREIEDLKSQRDAEAAEHSRQLAEAQSQPGQADRQARSAGSPTRTLTGGQDGEVEYKSAKLNESAKNLIEQLKEDNYALQREIEMAKREASEARTTSSLTRAALDAMEAELAEKERPSQDAAKLKEQAERAAAHAECLKYQLDKMCKFFQTQRKTAHSLAVTLAKNEASNLHLTEMLGKRSAEVHRLQALLARRG